MKIKKKAKYRISELKKPKNGKIGKVKKYNKNLEPHEDRTIETLSEYGFDVEALIPSNVPGSKNPDILMLGTLWEMKAPVTDDDETIASHFRKAVKQSGGKAIFDIRGAKKDPDTIEGTIMKLFATTRGMRRIMIIKKDAEDKRRVKILDIAK